ncbi:hypothetical protein A4G99_13875 [Haladaptatus sp. R4]|uniref:DUF7519 family protein n=1 Tax=Haladaptatus sp. R4 TaxID=1679489 RepID=UPI0007B46B6F|nr:hypothetical protein [Haladaptatus sp. R4]KZN23914.1 hypothetical protein A4G99_13875 [Haladaptatus sp. R4]
MHRSTGWISRGTPPLFSTVVALLAAFGVLLVTAVSVYTLIASVSGVVFLVVGLVRGSSEILTVGSAVLFGAVVVAGLLGIAPLFLLIAAFLTVISWDVGQNGLTITDEVGREVSTLRIEGIHLVSHVVVLTVGATIGYVAFRSATGGYPVFALIALLVGVIALLITLQE